MLAFVARTTGTRQIWVRRMDSPTARPLDGTENGAPMFWSPDSQSLAFTAGGKLRKIALAGGTPVVLCDQLVHSGTWNQDGVILFAVRGAGIKRMDANGGNVADVTTIDAAQGESAHYSPFFLPDGRHFLLYVYHNEPAKRGIYVRAIEGGQARLVLNTEVPTVWAGVNPAAPGEGWLMFMQQGALLAQSFDFTQHQVSGAPFRIADQVRTIYELGSGQFSLSNNGVLIFSEGRENQRLVLVDRQGQKLRTLGSPGLYSFPGFSPDGQRIVVGRVEPQNQGLDIHLLDLAGGRDIRFTVEPGEDGYPLWSPDGSRIV
jgi:Tol biopolymer transport system component